MLSHLQSAIIGVEAPQSALQQQQQKNVHG
jgi:hypothetical protein